MPCLHESCVTCLCLEAKGKEEGDGSHGTGIRMLVDYHVGAGNQT